MKLYKINVNGKSFEVEVESVTENTLKSEPKNVTPTNDQTTNILAPMQGTITKLNIKVGNTVKKRRCLNGLRSYEVRK